MSVRVIHGDSRHELVALDAGSIDSCVCDPPYALTSTTKRYAKSGRTESTMPKAAPFARATSGFMGQAWDTGETAFDPDFWREVFRVLKPGAHLVAFSGTRTYHRLVCAIEDAGFEIRDQIGWLFGNGFPKSMKVGDGWGTALKPAWEPICLARKPPIGTVAANVLEHGTGALNIDGCRVISGLETITTHARGKTESFPKRPGEKTVEESGRTVAQNRPEFIGNTRNGRWPANVIHDGSEEVVAMFPAEAGAFAAVHGTEPSNAVTNVYNARTRTASLHHGDSGSAARFFYTAKADDDDRLGSDHPTVKPVDLMQWLVRLVTPKGGLVLDPFAGTGTTGEAAHREGCWAILIEREAKFVEDIHRRVRLLSAGPDERRRETTKAKGETAAPGPLFGGTP